MAVQDQEGAAGYSGPQEQVHRQPFRKQCVLRPRAGLVATRTPLPLVAAPSLSQACPSPAPRLLLLQHLLMEQEQ